MDDERVVLLGVVQEKQGVDGASPYVCKAGGRPAWYGNEEPSEVQSLNCPKCKHGLFLVAQVYAPVDADRSLYVFGCNSPECAETPGSWRVLRHQVKAADEPLPVAAETRAVAPPPAPSPAPTSGWAAAGDDDSDWSDDDNEKDAESDASFGLDLESLLEQRDNASKSSATTAPVPTPIAAVVKATESKPKNTSAGSGATGKLNAFPALSIEVINEPYEDYIRENDYSHENKLLQAYIKSEEEEKSADVSDLRRILTATKKSNGDGGGASGGGGGGGSGESYERTPAQLKHFQRFQKRISRCPLQVLRYDYGGEPLWPTPIQKSKTKAPRCVCGQERLFEMQLTPTINYFLKVDDFAHTKLQMPQAAATGNIDAAAMGGGMDWASVVVFSCPKSCSQSREEYVYVLPAQS